MRNLLLKKSDQIKAGKIAKTLISFKNKFFKRKITKKSILTKKNELESFQEDVILKSGQTPYAYFGKNPFLFILVIIFFISAILKFKRDENLF